MNNGKMTDEELETMGLSPEEIAALREDDGDQGNDEGGDGNGEGNGSGDGEGKGEGDGAGAGEGDGKGEGAAAAAAAAGGEGEGAGAGDGQAAQQAQQQEPAAAAAPAAREPDPRIAEIETELNSLDEQFDNGDLTAAEYRAKQKELGKELDDLRWSERSVQLREQIDHENKVKEWGASIRSFLAVDEHQAFYKPDPKNPSLPYQALDAAVRHMQDQYRAAGKSDTDPSILHAAHALVLEQFGIQKAAPAAGGEGGSGGQQPAQQRKPAPPTLANIPAAAASETDTSQWGWLDRLRDNPDPTDPEKYERELAKLPKDKRDAYMAAG